MGDDSETFRFEAVPAEIPGPPVSRRTLLQSIAAISLTPAPLANALAAEDPADALPQERRRLRIDQRFVLFPINNESLSRRVRLVK